MEDIMELAEKDRLHTKMISLTMDNAAMKRTIKDNEEEIERINKLMKYGE